MDENLNQDLLHCKNISVVLKNRNSGRAYIESYRLNNIIFSGGRFWGKFSNAHCPHGHKNVGPFDPLSYAYNNYTPVVCTLSLNNRMEKFTSANAYSDISFVATGSYRKIWSKGADDEVLPVYNAIESGLKMKVIIESADGYFYIMPVHTIVMFEDNKDFVLETEFDGVPEKLRHFSYIETIANQFREYSKANPKVSYFHTDPVFNSEYFLTYFAITKTEVFQKRVDDNGAFESVSFDCNRAEIWLECE